MIAEGIYNNYKWFIKQNYFGYLTGYVLLNEDHPWFGKGYDELRNISVHGGRTKSCEYKNKQWLLGFDCGHKNDLPDPDFIIEERAKELRALFMLGDSLIEENYIEPSFKNKEYVEKECKMLIDQAIMSYQKDN